MSLTLWSGVNPENARTHKLLAAAALANVAVTLKACEYGRENETAEYCRNCSPCGRYPVLQTEEGCVFESNAILRHIARLDRSGGFLYGRTPLEGSQVDMWLDFSATELDAASEPFVHHAFRGEPLPANAMDRVHEVLRALEAWLETRTFLVGERMTVADVAVAFALQWHYRLNGAEGEALTKKYRNAYRLYNTVMQQPKTVEVLRSQGATFPGRRSERARTRLRPPGQRRSRRPPLLLLMVRRKRTRRRGRKKPNPLDELPPSPFVCWTHSSASTATRHPHGCCAVLLPALRRRRLHDVLVPLQVQRGQQDAVHDGQPDPGGSSAWSTCASTRSALHSSLGRRGGTIVAWVFRGRGMPAIVEDVEDTELFDWEEVADVAAQRERITDYLCWEGPTIPRPVLEGRVFK
ncbi:putative elongation factor 1-gamma [Trypanosoma cruzi]|nr:putative elongation factor 1-gamma [Trypanosoma cruzi]